MESSESSASFPPGRRDVQVDELGGAYGAGYSDDEVDYSSDGDTDTDKVVPMFRASVLAFMFFTPQSFTTNNSS